MKRFFTLIVILSALSISAQTTMRSVLTMMPDTIIPYLTANNRLDFVDFIDSGMKAEVLNAFNGKSVLSKLTDHYASIQLNRSSDLTLCLLDVETPVDSTSQIILVVWNFGSNPSESSVHFYTTGWKELKTNDYLSTPDEMFTAKIDENFQLMIKPSTYFDMPAEIDQRIEEKSSIILKWNKRRFN